jgi:hypothetical protein
MWQGTQSIILIFYWYISFYLWICIIFVAAKLEKLTPQEHGQCIVWFIDTRSDLHMQCNLKLCSSLNEACSTQPFPGVNIFSFALMKIINKLTNNEHTELLNHMQKTVLRCDPIWKLDFLKFERLHVYTLYCCDLWRKLTQNLIFWVVIQSSWKVEANVWQNCEATLSLWPWRCPSPLSVSISKIVVYKMTVATWHELKFQYSSLDIVQFFIF